MTKPANLVFIVGESHSSHLVGAYGHPLVKTPNLDRLASRGVLFENSYCTSPICVPSRASIATGQYPHQSGYWENSMALDGRAMTWMKCARDAGHQVTGIGKFHFRSEVDDNGFSEEVIPMHLAEGVGELIGLLRSTGEEPVRSGLWKLYTERSGVGPETAYQKYDKAITANAVNWLQSKASKDDETPWALSVHYVSAHAPYTVPQELFDLYPLDSIEIPPGFRPEDRPTNPAVRNLRETLGQEEDLDIDTLKRVIASYFATLTYLDMQVGQVMEALEDNGLSENTRIIYTADHGYSYGQHFIFGLFNLYEPSVSVPLIMAGPGIPQGVKRQQIASHVDLYPTALEALGVEQSEENANLLGHSLWPAIAGQEDKSVGFAEYHALGSRSGSFMLRDGDDKLIYHVGLPAQVFDLANDPDELKDLADKPEGKEKAQLLEQKLRSIVDPEEEDRRAKLDQKHLVDELGGKEKVLEMRAGFIYSPPPGQDWKAV